MLACAFASAVAMLFISEPQSVADDQEGVAAADEFASVDGVDIVFIARHDLGSFSGRSEGDPVYEKLISRVKTETVKAGKYLAGPSAWVNSRDGYQFFQGPGTSAVIQAGVRATLEASDPCRFLASGTAPVEGEAPCP